MRVTEASTIEQLSRETRSSLWWSLLAYTGSGEIASDAVAEAFAGALANVDAIRDPAAWVWRVAFRIATDELQATRGRLTEPEGSYEIDDRAIHVLTGLQHLSVSQRAVVVLYYLEDRPTKEIATMLGVAPTTVSVHLHRARQRLRSILGDDDA